MSQKQQQPKAPRHLKPATKRWWADVVDRWALEGHHVRLLTAAAESWDWYQQARAQIDADGLTTGTRDGGVKAHPALGVERDSRLAFARLLRELDLDLEVPADTKRIPALRSIG